MYGQVTNSFSKYYCSIQQHLAILARVYFVKLAYTKGETKSATVRGRVVNPKRRPVVD